ncbi:MAG: alkaline phosphatase family protein [Acidobacteria bacterium]|nr:alkaline phosphatase family protein [Acidobacteriota bacterium]
MPSATDNIKHLVLVMMENRSFDHLFGFLKSPDYPINGLNGNEFNPAPDGSQVKVSKNAQNAGDLWPDPGHDFIDTTEQIFNDRTIVNAGNAVMTGFVNNYQRHTNNPKKARRIMKCFDPARIPVLMTLAKEYAVCDNWFASVPGPTLPNRAFVHFSTSLGRVDMSPDWGGKYKTIYELLDGESPRVTAKIYYQDSTIAQTITYLKNNQGRFFGSFRNFTDDCKNNKLPTYCVVEPKFNNDPDFAASDQHPDHDMAEGERFLSDVYNAIRKNKAVWESTMLVIVYDEHGGLYDHVVPPATVSPDGRVNNVFGFKFERLGVRVPAVVVSPYIKKGTIISNVFDHTSVIATVRKLFTKGYSTNALTERDRLANTLEQCLTLDAPRTDTIKFPKPAPKPVADGFGLLAAPTEPKRKPKPKPFHQMSDFQKAMLMQGLAVENTLPLELQSGKTLRSFKTEYDVSAYLQDLAKRLQAAANGNKTASRPRVKKAIAKGGKQ